MLRERTLLVTKKASHTLVLLFPCRTRAFPRGGEGVPGGDRRHHGLHTDRHNLEVVLVNAYTGTLGTHLLDAGVCAERKDLSTESSFCGFCILVQSQV